LPCRLAFSSPSYAEAPEDEPSIGKAPERGRFHARGVEFSGGATHFLRPLRSREQDRNYQFVGADYGGFGRAGLRAGTAANCAAIIGGV